MYKLAHGEETRLTEWVNDNIAAHGPVIDDMKLTGSFVMDEKHKGFLDLQLLSIGAHTTAGFFNGDAFTMDKLVTISCNLTDKIIPLLCNGMGYLSVGVYPSNAFKLVLYSEGAFCDSIDLKLVYLNPALPSNLVKE